MPVNGVEYDHENLVMEVEGLGISTTLMEVSYDGGRDFEVITDQDGLPRGPRAVARKAYEGAFSCTLSREEFDALSEGVGEVGVLGRPSYRVVLSYQQDDESPTTDELTVRLAKFSVDSKEGETVKVKLEGKQLSVASIGGRPLFRASGRRGQ